MDRKKFFNKTSFLSVVVCGLVLSTVIHCYAEVPHLINYQGRLLQGGIPVSGTKSMTFKIWSAESGGNFLWEETQNNVLVTNGIFNVLLGSVNSIPTSVFEGSSVWLETIVAGTSLGRQKIVSVGYAFKAENADKLDNKDSTDFLLPRGVIVMWSGTVVSIPAGWHLCDGTAGTPDLRNKFIVGAGDSYSLGAIGGNNSVTPTITVGASGGHTHSSDGAHKHDTIAGHKHNLPFSINDYQLFVQRYNIPVGNSSNYWWGNYGRGDTLGYTSTYLTTFDAGGHTHTSDGSHQHNAILDHTHPASSSTIDNRPPYYALAYIMKS